MCKHFNILFRIIHVNDSNKMKILNASSHVKPHINYIALRKFDECYVRFFVGDKIFRAQMEILTSRYFYIPVF
jgi:hypothetical protein